MHDARIERRLRCAIVYKTLPHYRRSFFELLRRELERDGIDLVLVHGKPFGMSQQKRDWGELPGAIVIENRVWRFGTSEVIWQPCLPLLRGCDLVIAEQASRLLVNYVFHLWSAIGYRKFALWGHGRNMQVHSVAPAAEWLKRWLLRSCDWWFAYTAETRRFLEARGVAPERVTCVDNAVNAAELVDAADHVDPERVSALRGRFGLAGRNVALFIGSFYAEKRLPFLIEACRSIRKAVPDFEMIFIGAGPEEGLLRAAAADLPFLHVAGQVKEADKLPFFAVSKLLLMPGLVGLAITDAINFGVPIVTVDLPYHSPEIEYLRHRKNGLLLPRSSTADDYAGAVARLLLDEPARRLLRDGCREERFRYTADAMAQRFATGVRRCLGVENAVDPAPSASPVASPL
jgi:glycosyltransferase involved in cell wall biosynthesis